MANQPLTIPDWDFDGVLPAFDVGHPTAGIRSPYVVSLFSVVSHFGNTIIPRQLLRGLLDLRTSLHRLGLDRGFQWINGSFVENVEARNGRPPNDIDIVTFFYIPSNLSVETLQRDYYSLFDPAALKNEYYVDGYYVQLNQTTAEEMINETTYWYSLWSHTRGGKWKGYLQIDLSGTEDDLARLQLEQFDEEAGGQA